MSRADYSDDCSGWDLIRWRGAVTSAIRGERGQKLLHELAEALDAMPVKRLIAHEFKNLDGEFCALGALGAKRGMDLTKLDPECPDGVAKQFGIANALAREIMFTNDEVGWGETTPERRWTAVRKWVGEQIKQGDATCE